MDNPRIYWVDAPLEGRLAVVARPRSPAQIAALKPAGIDILVSLLEADEAAELGLAEASLHCTKAGIEFISVAITDHGVPRSYEDMETVVGYLAGQLGQGLGIGAHCFAGLGRSPLLVAATLIDLGFTLDTAIEMVSEARGYDVPEMGSQHDWLLGYALRRQGIEKD